MREGKLTVTIVWEDPNREPLVCELHSEERRFVSWNRVQEIGQNFVREGIHRIGLDDFKRRRKDV